MEKVLFISNRLRPSNNAEAFQSTMIAKYLSVDCETHVVSTTKTPTDTGSSIHYHIPQTANHSTNSRVEHFFSRAGKNIKFTFPDNQNGWVEAACQKASQIITNENIKILITRSMPISTHQIGLSLKQLHPDVKWIASLSDPISINPYHIFPSRKSKARIVQYEMDIFNRADIVTHSNAFATGAYRSMYNKLPSRQIVLTNMFDRNSVETSRHICSGTGPMVLTYAGRFYGRRTPEPLFKAIRLFLDSGNYGGLKMNIVGAGKSRLLDSLVKKYGLSDIVISRPFMDPDMLAELLVGSHLLVTMDGDFPGDNIFLPSKVIDYLSMTVPILGITRDGPTVRLLEDTGSGFWAEPGDVKGISNLLQEHHEKIKKGYEFFPDHGSVMAYHSANVIKQFCSQMSEQHGN